MEPDIRGHTLTLKKTKWPLTKLVEVEWEDITSENGGWSSIDDSKKNSHCVIMKSAGYLLEKNKKYVKICMTQADEDMGLALVKTFPIGCVKKIRTLK